MNVLYRNSSNHIEFVDLVDRHEKLASGAPTPVETDVVVTAQIYASDRATPIGAPITLTQEADQPQNFWRGIFPKTIDFGVYTEVSIKCIVDGGGPTAYHERFVDVKVVDE